MPSERPGPQAPLARGGGLVLLLVLAVLYPQAWSNPAVVNYGVLALIFATAAVAWHIFSGNTGYISLGQAVFYGSGAYAMGIAARDWHMTGTAVFELLPLCAAVGALIAIPFGLIALRVRRHTFIVITIAIFFIFQLMAFNFWFTGGSSGLGSPFLSWAPQPYNQNFYYIALACTVGAVLIAWLVGRSRFGLQLRAIRDDEDRARGLGVKAMRVKLSAFAISGAITALIGGVWFYYIEQVEPQTGFNPLFDLTLVLMVFLGGFGSISGAVLGALIIEPLTLWMNTQPAFSGSISEVIIGAIFLLVVLFMPRGIIPTGGEFIKKLRTRGRPAVVPATTMGPCRPALGRPPALSAQEVPGDRAAAHRGDQEGLRRRPGAERRHDRGRGGHRRRPDRAERVRQDHPVQRHHRLRAAGRGPGLVR